MKPRELIGTAKVPGGVELRLFRHDGDYMIVLAHCLPTGRRDNDFEITHLGWLAAVVPFSSYYRTVWLGLGTIAFELLFAILVTSLIRGFIGQAAWRLVHWLSYASWPIAVLHGAGTGTDAFSAWLLALQAACVIAVLGAIVYRLMTGSRDPLATARSDFQSAVDRREPR